MACGPGPEHHSDIDLSQSTTIGLLHGGNVGTLQVRPKSSSPASRIRRVRRVYEFIKDHRDEFDVTTMCRVLDVARAGYYAWLQEPLSDRAKEDARLLGLIRASYKASHGVYGARRVFLDLREAGETCSKHRVERLMRQNDIKALHGYRPRYRAASKPSVAIPNLLQRNFDVIRPNKVWVTDITYIRTWEGWLQSGQASPPSRMASVLTYLKPTRNAPNRVSTNHWPLQSSKLSCPRITRAPDQLPNAKWLTLCAEVATLQWNQARRRVVVAWAISGRLVSTSGQQDLTLRRGLDATSEPDWVGASLPLDKCSPSRDLRQTVPNQLRCAANQATIMVMASVA